MKLGLVMAVALLSLIAGVKSVEVAKTAKSTEGQGTFLSTEKHTYIPQTWNFLRDSAAHVGDVAQEVLNVQNNIDLMKADVEQGAAHWKEVQGQLIAENEDLRSKIAFLLAKQQENERYKAAFSRAEADVANLKGLQSEVMKQLDEDKREKNAEKERITILIQETRERTANYTHYANLLQLQDQDLLGKKLSADEGKAEHIRNLKKQIEQEKANGGFKDLKVSEKVQEAMTEIRKLQVKYDSLNKMDKGQAAIVKEFRDAEKESRKQTKDLENLKKAGDAWEKKCAADTAAMKQKVAVAVKELQDVRAETAKCVALKTQNAKLERQLEAC